MNATGISAAQDNIGHSAHWYRNQLTNAHALAQAQNATIEDLRAQLKRAEEMCWMKQQEIDNLMDRLEAIEKAGCQPAPASSATGLNGDGNTLPWVASDLVGAGQRS